MNDGNGGVVAVGGGHGLARTLNALLRLGQRPTAIVTVADDGGSSGRLRRDHGIIAVGDMRMALQTLAQDSDMARLFAHRFGQGTLHGHALGNLALLALAETHGGDFVAAVHEAGQMMGCRGTVIPCTTDDVTLVAAVDGAVVDGQVAVAHTPGRHRSVWLEPRDPKACPEAVAAIHAAEAIVLGPGSLFTSVIPNLLVPDIARAIASSAGPVVYVANLTTQRGETDGMDLVDHVDALLDHLPGQGSIEVIVHAGPQPTGGGSPLKTIAGGPRIRRVRATDLAARRADGTVVAAHDPVALSRVLKAALDR
ncbi:MAG TPA: gluconeogenesis factor YvcK family protein [Euzebya sp.]|nr:gluconeogenesis factor YvcK family protein [Euzebya sp.]